MANRHLSCSRLLSWHFFAVILLLTFSYYLFVWEYMLTLKPSYYLPALIIFHLSFAMLTWSMITSIVSDPGRVPIYWGFFLDERQTKKRRYCLLCHSFKPQRCHHCSTCQRCVLNMDHHCPWISNCVGWSNRKFFMLFLFYIILTIIIVLSITTPSAVDQIHKIIQKPSYGLNPHTIIRLAGFLLIACFGVIISFFFKFHLQLVLKNTSTLQNLQKARNPQQVAPNNTFDVGSYENWTQVFGTNVLLWPFPLFGESGKPKGDGVEWKKNVSDN